MMYVKSSGTVTEAGPHVVENLLSGTNHSMIEDALPTLNYHSAIHIGRENAAELEIHMNTNPDANPAAIAFVTLGEYYETYIIQTRHAALLFVKDYANVIRDICETDFTELDD